MGLRSIIAANLPRGFKAGGEPAVFSPADGDPILCMVFIEFDVQLQPAGNEAQIWQQGTTIEALLSEIGREPNRDETFTVDSIVYTVQSIIENDGLTVTMVVI